MQAISLRIPLFALALFAGCNSLDESPQTNQLTFVRVGVLPDADPEALRDKYETLLDFVSAEIGIPYTLTIAESYQALTDLFTRGDIDLARFGGYSFAVVSEQVETIPLVQRDVDRYFTSYFIARTSESAADLSDFRDTRLGFGSELSTSGHFMPRAYLRSKGIEPEVFFEDVVYCEAQDQNVFNVRDGNVDLGAVNSQIYDQLVANGDIRPDQVRIVAETPPFANDVWTVHASMPEADRIRIRDAFLSLSPAIEAHRLVLESAGARTFLPAKEVDYLALREAVRARNALQGRYR